jgi:hypothetical protein
VHGGVLGERERVDRLDRLVERVAEDLRDLRRLDVAGDVDLHVGVLERAGPEILAVTADGAQGALNRRRGLGQRWGGGEGEEREERTAHGEEPPRRGSSKRRAP